VSAVYGLAGILKANGYVVTSEGFDEQPAVMNGASPLLAEVLGNCVVHARTAIGVHSPLGGAPVEPIASLSA
jgi:hypothetical protein